MNRASNSIAAAAIVLALLTVMAGRYQGYVNDRNYVLKAAVPCDPADNSCFVSTCQSGDDPGCEPYAKVQVLARNAPSCLEEHACTTFSCEGRPECRLSYCSHDTLEAGERCEGEWVSRPD